VPPSASSAPGRHRPGDETVGSRGRAARQRRTARPGRAAAGDGLKPMAVPEEAPHLHADDLRPTYPGQIADGALVARMDPLRPPLAERTPRSLPCGGGNEGDLLVSHQEGFHAEGAQVREEGVGVHEEVVYLQYIP
jgi:hypothetical protein